MTVWGVVLVAVALTVTAVAPLALTRSPWTLDRPRTALTAWGAAVVVGVAGFVAGVSLVVVGDRRGDDPFRLLSSPTHGAHLVVAAVAVLAFVVAVRVRPGPEQEAVRAALRTGATDRRRVAGTDVAVVEGTLPLACAVPGGSGTVLVSTGLADHLSPGELDAVVAHEAAHLRGRHAGVVALTESIERAVPWIPGARAMARSSRVLVELAADDAAARRVGPDLVARAVRSAAALEADTGARSPLCDLRVARMRRASTPRRGRAGGQRWRGPETSRKKSA